MFKSHIFFLALPLLCFLGFFYVAPLFQMLGISFFSPEFTFRHYVSFFTQSIYIFSLYVTLRVALIVTVFCLLLGYPLAYYLSKIPRHKANILMVFVLIPLWTSILVRTLAWITILGRNGVINQTLMKLGLIDVPIKMIFNSFGLTLGMIHVMVPFMVLSLYSVMTGIDRSLLRAAQNLGASPFEAFRKVFLPLSIPGIMAGSILVFVISVGFFVTPALLGGPKDIMLSMLIDQNVSVILNWSFASAMSFILMVIVMTLFVVSAKLIGFEKLWGKKA